MQKYKFTKEGNSIMTLTEKVDALKYCIEQSYKDRGTCGGPEDELGHVCDLLRFFAKQMDMTPEEALAYYGKGEIAIEDPKSIAPEREK